ncbi:hypothetical protein HPB49_008393 [Dermacentor silvarum]|uniref:Uncharacterized protein n=1 Tax=Dermacentor silvarum TaxID=543639 RepID=A0ACB8DBY1_DERSI|nr:hypothetical protein HPB49_008393 [Dermacentor silvarum]
MVKEPARGTDQNKGRSPIFVILLLSLIPVMFGAALAIRYVTRGPRVVHVEVAPTTTPVTTTSTVATTTVVTTVKVVVPVDLTVPYKPKPGTESHTGELPLDVHPKSYDVTITLNGTNLADDMMHVTGRAVALYKAEVATSKLILKALPQTIKEVKVALLETTPTSATTPTGLNITTLSSSGSFLVAALEKPLAVGKSYTLITEYNYEKAAQEGPIKLAAELTKMVLEKDKAHFLFPCSEKADWNVPVTLTLITPKKLTAVSNEPLDGSPAESGGFTVHKFKPTKAMPLDMLAWNLFPDTMKSEAAIPDKLKIHIKAEKPTLTATAKMAFEYLQKFFQKAGEEHIPKIDLVFVGQASQVQESLGIIVLQETIAPPEMCAKIANQWTHVLMRQPNTPTWLGSTGVAYLCQLAVTEESTLDLLVFRMVHIILGDTAIQTAIQITKEQLVHWRQETYVTKKLKRDIGATKKVTWSDPGTGATPFATDTTVSAVNVRAPTDVKVAWLDSNNAAFTVTAEDTKPLYVNPSVMACYGIELNPEWWALIGKDMESTPPDAINAWYLLGEAAKQYSIIQRQQDFTGYLWMWAALKSGDKDLWDEHVKQLVETERVAYSLLGTVQEEANYKARIKALIAAKVHSITPQEITSENAKEELVSTRRGQRTATSSRPREPLKTQQNTSNERLTSNQSLTSVYENLQAELKIRRCQVHVLVSRAKESEEPNEHPRNIKAPKDVCPVRTHSSMLHLVKS